MSGNKGHGPMPEEQNYESVVLDFLDREMAAVQPADRKGDHSDDLDALVSDLLKQVISETDQAETPTAAYDETKAMLAEFPPVETGPLELKPRTETDAASHPAPATQVVPNTEPTALKIKGGGELAALEVAAEMELATIMAQSETEAATEPATLESEGIMELGALEPETDLATLEAQSEMELAILEVEPAPAHSATGKGHRLETATKEPPAPAAVVVPKRIQPVTVKAKAAPKSEAAAAPSAADAQGATTPFAAPGRAKSNKPALAIAAACLLAATGFGTYHFLSGSGETPATVSTAPAVMDPIVVSAEPGGAEPALVQPKPSIAQPPVAQKTVTPPPVTIKTQAAAPVATAVPVPAPPKDERPGLLHGTDQIAAASRRSAIDGLIPASAPGRAAPAAPRPPRPTKAQAAAPQVSGILVPAVPVSQVTPRYPEIAVRTRTSAVVDLDIVIDANGRVIEASPVSGPVMFHKEAVDAAMKWRYRPASIGGSNVQSQTRIIMKFNLK